MIDVALLAASQTPFLPASSRAPGQEAAARAASPVPLQAPRLRPPLAESSAKNLVVFTPAANDPRRQPPKSHERFVRDAKIPIDRARPTSPQPPRGFLLGSQPAPAARHYE